MSAIFISLNSLCATATITQSAFFASSIGLILTPYSFNASFSFAHGSITVGSISYLFNCLIISSTLLFLVSGQFSLNVIPKITTFDFLGA